MEGSPSKEDLTQSLILNRFRIEGRQRPVTRAPIKGASCRPGASLQRRGFAHRIRTSNYLALASGFVIARAVSTNNSASGLSVRFFNVMIAIVPRALANSTGNALSEGCLLGSINV